MTAPSEFEVLFFPFGISTRSKAMGEEKMLRGAGGGKRANNDT